MRNDVYDKRIDYKDHTKDIIDELVWNVAHAVAMVQNYNNYNSGELRLAMNAKTYSIVQMNYAIVVDNNGGRIVNPTLCGIRVVNDESLDDGCVAVMRTEFTCKPFHPEWW